MKMRLLSLLIIVGGLVVGPAAAANADTTSPTRPSGTITLPTQAQQLGRYWS